MRKLPIQNFRPLGGYTNQYGEKMRSDKIFRGASLDRLTAEDAAYMANDLGITHVLDYRDEQEAAACMDVLAPNMRYERISALQVEGYSSEGFDFDSLLSGEVNQEKLRFLVEYLQSGYRTMALGNPAFRRYFELLLQGDGNIYFHCSAGKDRTGVCGFLTMLALGIREEDCVREYLLSNEFLRPNLETFYAKQPELRPYREICDRMMLVEERNLRLTIDSIKARYASYEQFLEREYGLDECARSKLRLMYCT